MWWRHNDGPEETCVELSCLISTMVAEFREQVEKITNNLESLELIAQDLQARGDEIFESEAPNIDAAHRVGESAYGKLWDANDGLRALRDTFGRS
jgi:hypothetical protein